MKTYAMVHTPSESVAETRTCPFALMTVFTGEHSAYFLRKRSRCKGRRKKTGRLGRTTRPRQRRRTWKSRQSESGIVDTARSRILHTTDVAWQIREVQPKRARY